MPAYEGIESGALDRGEVERCSSHARLLAAALEWFLSDPAKRDAMVVECHSAQSSGSADLLLLNGCKACLVEAGAGEGNVAQKHKDDLKVLNREAESLLFGKVVNDVERYRVVRASARNDLPLNARNAVLATVGDAIIVRC